MENITITQNGCIIVTWFMTISC